MTHSIGADQAKEVADEHEGKGGNPQAEKDMDLFNNNKGRELGNATKGKGDDAAKNACRDAANSGALKTLG